MINIILNIKTDSIKIAKASGSNDLLHSNWFWFSIIEFIVIVFLLINLKKKNTELAFSDVPEDKLKNAKSSPVDMDNLMNSINGSRELYIELSKACHPDKFVNTDQQKLAEDIFQEISKNKRNYEKLVGLKERAKKELNINFK